MAKEMRLEKGFISQLHDWLSTQWEIVLQFNFLQESAKKYTEGCYKVNCTTQTIYKSV